MAIVSFYEKDDYNEGNTAYNQGATAAETEYNLDNLQDEEKENLIAELKENIEIAAKVCKVIGLDFQELLKTCDI